MVHLVTGYKGVEHIQSEDTRAYNRAMFGNGDFVMESGNKLRASIISTNVIRVLDGDVLMQGGHIRIEPNTYEDLTFDTGTLGYQRIDLIVLTYEKNPSDTTETAYLEIIKGTETSGTPSTPSIVTGDLSRGAIKHQMILYKVLINVNPRSITRMFDYIPSYKTLSEEASEEYWEELNAIRNSNFIETVESVLANTQRGKFTGALALKELIQSLDDTVMAVDSAEEVENPITMTDIYDDGTIIMSRSGNMVTINLVGATWGDVSELTIPNQFTPFTEFAGTLYVVDINSTNRFLGLCRIKNISKITGSRISSNGTNTSIDSSFEVYGSITYPVQDFTS